MRYKLIIEYDGTDFYGWQRQEKQISVQQVLEDALTICTKEQVTLFAAGRTDTGVHAVGQVIHFDLNNVVDPFVLQGSINALVCPHEEVSVSTYCSRIACPVIGAGIRPALSPEDDGCGTQRRLCKRL